MLCLYDTLLMIVDLLPDLIVLTIHQVFSAATIIIIFDMNIHVTKPSTLVHDREYLL